MSLRAIESAELILRNMEFVFWRFQSKIIKQYFLPILFFKKKYYIIVNNRYFYLIFIKNKNKNASKQ